MLKKMFIIFGIISFLTASSIMAQVDTDGDGIFDDGDNSGIVGDNPCTHMNTQNCDDNCINDYNPNQEDYDYDGVGEYCCCVLAGDANEDGVVNLLDISRIIQSIFEKNRFGSICWNTADVNADCAANILDITFLISYLYYGGPAPKCGCVF